MSLVNRISFVSFLALTATQSAMASVCTSGENQERKLLAQCKAFELDDERSGETYNEMDFCVSREWRDGGPFGGEKIPWYFIQVSLKDGLGNIQTHTFDSPDGRNNFRSMLDWTDLSHLDDQLSLTSHRTVYERPMGPGKLHLHELAYDFSAGNFSFVYDRKERVNFGSWTEVLSVNGVCR